jgi:hypothetical protein
MKLAKALSASTATAEVKTVAWELGTGSYEYGTREPATERAAEKLLGQIEL